MTTEIEEKTEFKFSELSDRAKDKARGEYRSGDYPGYDWWDGVYEDAVRMGALIGIEISTTQHLSHMPNGKPYTTIDISFSGFYSQGDGASFEGSYRYKPDAVAKVTAECKDQMLLRIAEQLTVIQLTRRLQGHEPWKATIPRSPRNYIKTIVLDADDLDPHESIDEDVETEMLGVMRDFADWIYKQLEAEYDYLTSDECVDERLNDDETLFDEDGMQV